MEQEYRVSRRIIVILTVVISLVVFINEEISLKVVGTTVFAGIALLVGHIGTGASRKMIQMGDRISNVFFRFFYYVLLLVLICTSAWLFYFFVILIYDAKPHSDDFATALGEALLLVFGCASFFVFLLIPYIQTLIVLFLRKGMKNNI